MRLVGCPRAAVGAHDMKAAVYQHCLEVLWQLSVECCCWGRLWWHAGNCCSL